jgi:hypothetical protein
VAKSLAALVSRTNEADRAILIAATTWPNNLTLMGDRPAPGAAATGAGAIPAFIRLAQIIDIRETFTSSELEAAKNSTDPRLQAAAHTATKLNQPHDGWKVTQVLAGGTALVARLHPPRHEHVERQFSPGARAVLHAAADLRRVGLTGPIPRWVIEGTAPSYLVSPHPQPVHTWLPAALDETIRDATRDDALTNTYLHDNHRHGVPALTPTWTSHPVTGAIIDAYLLHDYLYQDHLYRHGHTCTRQALWDTLVERRHDLPPDIRVRAGENAARRGMVTSALLLWTEEGRLAELQTAHPSPRAQFDERVLEIWGVVGDVDSLDREFRSGEWRAEPVLAVVLGARRHIKKPSYHDVYLTAEYYDGMGYRGELDDPASKDPVVRAWRETSSPSRLGEQDPAVIDFIENVQSRDALGDRAGKWLLSLFYRRYPGGGELESLKNRALKGDSRSQILLCAAYRARRDISGLRELVHLGTPDAAASLANILRVTADISPRIETELDARGELLQRRDPPNTLAQPDATGTAG